MKYGKNLALIISAVCLILIIIGSANASSEKYLVTFYITDETGDPIDGAEVIIGRDDSRYTEYGLVEFELPQGVHEIQVSHPDYETTNEEVSVSGPSSHQIEMKEKPESPLDFNLLDPPQSNFMISSLLFIGIFVILIAVALLFIIKKSEGRRKV